MHVWNYSTMASPPSTCMVYAWWNDNIGKPMNDFLSRTDVPNRAGFDFHGTSGRVVLQDTLELYETCPDCSSLDL